MKKFGILAWPAFQNKVSNPYNFLLYSNMEEHGYHVLEFEFNIKNIVTFIFSNNYRIFHIHWPTTILTYSSDFQIFLKLLLLKFFLKTIKLLNKKIVWTVHNLKDHESQQPLFEKKLYKILYQYVDGFISLNQSGLEHINALATNKIHQRFKYIPHLHYKNYYPNDIKTVEARKRLEIPNDKFIFLFLGQIRSYKNLNGLINSFLELKNDRKFLLIAGSLHQEISDQIRAKLKTSKMVLLFDEFVKDEELQIYFNASDLVVTPYKRIFNSGSVFLNLSFNKPTLAPAIGIFNELKLEFGENFIKLYKSDISADILKDAMEEVIFNNNVSINIEPELNLYDPKTIAQETLSFYKKLL